MNTVSDSAKSTPADAATWRGEQLRLPQSGEGSLAGFGSRLGAFLIDSLLATAVAAFFVRNRGHDLASRLPGSWSLLAFMVGYVGGLLFAGRTIGMLAFGLRVVRVDAHAAVGPIRAVVRAALLAALFPALITDRDGRGLHDRLTDTAVIRSARRAPQV
jgi:uncharacterized RDD family membrane protein YckC